MTKATRGLTPVYYGVLLALQLLAITGKLPEALPSWPATKVGKDSESLLLAIGLPAWIQFARPRLLGTRREWLVTGLTVAALLGLGFWMYVTPPVPGKVETLNEPLFALAALVPYAQLRRPVHRLLSVGLPTAVLLLILFASGSALVTNLAEFLAMLVLVPLALDVIDRGVLDPAGRTSAGVRWTWYALMLVAPMFISLMLADAFAPGAAADAVRYAIRVQEAWIGVLLMQLYFAVGHGRTGTTHPAAGTAAPAPAAELKKQTA